MTIFLCDACKTEVKVANLDEYAIIIKIDKADSDQNYIDEQITHLCKDCRQNLLLVIKNWYKANKKE